MLRHQWNFQQFSSPQSMKPEEKLDLIKQEIKDLSSKKVQLEKKQWFYERWFVYEPELKEIETEIARLDKREGELYKVIQVLIINLECSIRKTNWTRKRLV